MSNKDLIDGVYHSFFDWLDSIEINPCCVIYEDLWVDKVLGRAHTVRKATPKEIKIYNHFKGLIDVLKEDQEMVH